jgi:hypothetical protein
LDVENASVPASVGGAVESGLPLSDPEPVAFPLSEQLAAPPKAATPRIDTAEA